MKLNMALYRKELEWLSLAKKALEENDGSNYISSVRDAIYDLFYDGVNFRSEFVMLIPVNELAFVRRTMDFMKLVSGYGSDNWSGNSATKKVDELCKDVKRVESILKTQLSYHSKFTIFYSWQSDLNDKFNRSFIEDALKKAIDKVNISSSLGIKFTFDKDTRKASGSPDIVELIFNKIDSALGFVADITPICKSGNKGIPNPNVMCELGYALSSLSDERVILVYNAANCNNNDIPFDLRQKRCISYKYDATTPAKDRREEKERLKNTFEEAITAIAEL